MANRVGAYVETTANTGRPSVRVIAPSSQGFAYVGDRLVLDRGFNRATALDAQRAFAEVLAQLSTQIAARQPRRKPYDWPGAQEALDASLRLGRDQSPTESEMLLKLRNIGRGLLSDPHRSRDIREALRSVGFLRDIAKDDPEEPALSFLEGPEEPGAMGDALRGH